MGGSSVVGSQYGQPGVYGTLGTPAAGNIPGGRTSASSWTDSKGNFWLFGGMGYSSPLINGALYPGYLNDVWEFDPSTNEWTWMGGSNATGYGSGYPGVYGTLGAPASGNMPGGRYEASSWTDSHGNFWLLGGLGYDAADNKGDLNDLWEFTPSTNEWTWMGGSSTVSVNLAYPGVYGTLGTPAPGNIPGSRYTGSAWTDSTDRLWLFGGQGDDALGHWGYLNDVWEFDPSTNEWTWMGGSSTVPPTSGGSGGQSGVYGTLGAPASGNILGGRYGNSNWTDTSGNFWLSGGQGYDSNGNEGYLNDLWEFNPIANEWVWMGGSSTMSCGLIGITAYGSGCGEPGVYGKLGVPATGNIPGGRQAALTWTDSTGHFWLFGGEGYDVNGLRGILNDLWEYRIISPAAAPAFSVVSGTYFSAQTVTITDATTGAAIYYTTDGTTPTTNSTAYTGAITVSTSETIQAIAVATGYTTSTVASATYTIVIPPSFTVAASPATLTVNSGASGTSTLTVTPANGFNSAVTFTCSGLPNGTTCSFSPTTVTPSGSAATSQLTITAAQSAAIHPDSQPLFPASALALAVCFIGLKRRRIRGLLPLALAAIVLSFVSACGGGGSGGPAPTPTPTPTTSTVTVTATSGSIQQSATITLTLN
jgi:N-acetylneuraminic acid mutarotase